MFIVFPQIQQAATIRFDNVASLRSYWKTLDRNPAFTLLIGRIELEKPPTAAQLRRLPCHVRALVTRAAQ
jgi:hypothetical protein